MIKGCDKLRQVWHDGTVSPCCGREHNKQWVAEGLPRHPEKKDPCHLCGAKHNVTSCPRLAGDFKAKLESELGYVHGFKWWHNVVNVAKARILWAEQDVAPQMAQTYNSVLQYTHGAPVYNQ